eukprot:gene882-3477_t
MKNGVVGRDSTLRSLLLLILILALHIVSVLIGNNVGHHAMKDVEDGGHHVANSESDCKATAAAINKDPRYSGPPISCRCVGTWLFGCDDLLKWDCEAGCNCGFAGGAGGGGGGSSIVRAGKQGVSVYNGFDIDEEV